LCHFLRGLAIVQKMISETEDHRLVLAHQRLEITTATANPRAGRDPSMATAVICLRWNTRSCSLHPSGGNRYSPWKSRSFVYRRIPPAPRTRLHSSPETKRHLQTSYTSG